MADDHRNRAHRGHLTRTGTRAAFWIALATSLLFALLPQPPDVGIADDKYQHMLAFAVLALLSALGWPTSPWWGRLFGLAAFGALIELLQLIPALHRSADRLDWFADVAAAALMLALAEAIGSRRRARGA